MKGVLKGYTARKPKYAVGNKVLVSPSACDDLYNYGIGVVTEINYNVASYTSMTMVPIYTVKGESVYGYTIDEDRLSLYDAEPLILRLLNDVARLEDKVRELERVRELAEMSDG